MYNLDGGKLAVVCLLYSDIVFVQSKATRYLGNVIYGFVCIILQEKFL